MSEPESPIEERDDGWYFLLEDGEPDGPWPSREDAAAALASYRRSYDLDDGAANDGNDEPGA